jgi:membrane associated rhomboid family serine protease
MRGRPTPEHAAALPPAQPTIEIARAGRGVSGGRRSARNCHALRVKSPVRERYAGQLDGLRALGVLVATMWAVEFVNALDSYRLDRDGIVPRNLSHLDGILFAPFLHASFSHLLGNTVPFVVLGLVIAFAGVRRLLLVSLIVALVSGLGTWLTAPGGSVTVGASGVVFGYATYLISRGLFNRRTGEVLLGIVVMLLFGGALISDLVPHSGISWEAHLFGGIGGVLAAAALARPALGRPCAPGATSLPASPR